MENGNLKRNTQEGLLTEESLPSPSGGGSSTYSGGGTNCFVGRQAAVPRTDETGKTNMDSRLASDFNTDDLDAEKRTTEVCKSADELAKEKDPVVVVTLPSDTDTDQSMETVASGQTSTSSRRKRPGPDDSESGLDSDDQTSVELIGKPARPAKRGRGRPRKTGAQTDMAKAREAFLKTSKEEASLLAEEDILKKAKSLERASGDNLSTDELAVHAQTAVDLVLCVAKKSGNLKGTMIRSLKQAAVAIQDAVEALKCRTQGEEVELLRAANARQAKELAEMRAEVAKIRTDLGKQRTEPQPAQSEKEREEAMFGRLMLQLGNMIDAKLAFVKDSLPPEKRLPPPLKAGAFQQKESPEQSASTSAKRTAASVAAVRHKPKPSKGKGKGQSDNPSIDSATQGQVPSASAQVALDAGWTTVEPKKKRRKKKKSKKGEKESPAATAPKASVSESTSRRKAQKPESGKKAEPKLRPPRSSAVVLTLQPGAMESGATYATILARARESVSIGELGITGLKIRTAATGARILEVPGATSAGKADELAAKLRQVLPEDAVRIARPVKCAEMRISGLDDSVTEAEVVAALAKSGDCSAESIRTGQVRFAPSGNGTIFVRCPISAATKIASSRLLVGWVSARVEVLPSRRMRCFRCLEVGHTRTQCQSIVDRSDECFRCGEKGHKAAVCVGRPHCSLCAAAGRPAEHRAGAPTCKGTQPKKAKIVAPASNASARSSSGAAPGEAMVIS